MKKKQRWIVYSLGAVAAAVPFVPATLQACRLGSFYLGGEWEKLCYATWVLLLAGLFCSLGKGTRQTGKKLGLGFGLSLTYTLAVFLANNFWRYLNFNSLFHWESPLPFTRIAWKDLIYSEGYGEYRYLIVFGVMMAFCLLEIVVSHPVMGQVYFGIRGVLARRRYVRALRQENLAEVYEDYAENFAEKRFIDYVRFMDPSEENKNELIRCIEQYEDHFLVYLLFVRFGELLSEEEYRQYRVMYFERLEAFLAEQREYYNTVEIKVPEVLEKLDERFAKADK